LKTVQRDRFKEIRARRAEAFKDAITSWNNDEQRNHSKMTDRMPTDEEFETTTGDEVRDALLLLSQRGYDIYAWEPDSAQNS
jgi:hypothetical protein